MSDLNDTIDVHCVDDFLPSMPAVSGHVALAQRLARRLTTPRGRLPYWPEFGYDLRQVLLSKRSPHVVAAAVEAECLKDEQVDGRPGFRGAIIRMRDSKRCRRSGGSRCCVRPTEGPYTIDVGDGTVRALVTTFAGLTIEEDEKHRDG